MYYSSLESSAYSVWFWSKNIYYYCDNYDNLGAVFTRDVGYIIPTLSRQCIDNPTAQLDLGLFEFLMHHGLYHRPSDVNSSTGANDTAQIWTPF